VQVDCEQDKAKLLHIKSEHELHMRKAENVRSSMNRDKEIGLSKPDQDAFTTWRKSFNQSWHSQCLFDVRLCAVIKAKEGATTY